VTCSPWRYRVPPADSASDLLCFSRHGSALSTRGCSLVTYGRTSTGPYRTVARMTPGIIDRTFKWAQVERNRETLLPQGSSGQARPPDPSRASTGRTAQSEDQATPTPDRSVLAPRLSCTTSRSHSRCDAPSTSARTPVTVLSVRRQGNGHNGRWSVRCGSPTGGITRARSLARQRWRKPCRRSRPGLKARSRPTTAASAGGSRTG
jgi:hypothetical protein